MQLPIFVDVDHAGKRVTCRSQTNILVFTHMVLIGWLSKRQNNIKLLFGIYCLQKFSWSAP